MQKLYLIGNLGKDAQVVESMNGRKFLSFSVAANGYRNGEQKTSWYSVIWFNYTENMVKYLTKGKSVVVVGELDADMRTDNNGVARIDRTVVADSVTFLNTGVSNGDNTSNPTPKSNPTQEVNTSNDVTRKNVSLDDELTTISKRSEEIIQQKPVEFDDSDLPF